MTDDYLGSDQDNQRSHLSVVLQLDSTTNTPDDPLLIFPEGRNV